MKLNVTLTEEQVDILQTMLAKDNDDLAIKDLNVAFKVAVIKAKAKKELKTLQGES